MGKTFEHDLLPFVTRKCMACVTCDTTEHDLLYTFPRLILSAVEG